MTELEKNRLRDKEVKDNSNFMDTALRIKKDIAEINKILDTLYTKVNLSDTGIELKLELTPLYVKAIIRV